MKQHTHTHKRCSLLHLFSLISIQFQLYLLYINILVQDSLQLQHNTISVSNSNFMLCDLMAILCERNRIKRNKKEKNKTMCTQYMYTVQCIIYQNIYGYRYRVRGKERKNERSHNRRNHFKYMLNTSFPQHLYRFVI